MTVVGVVGLGDIGRGVAAGIAHAGLDLVVCDVRQEAMDAFADRGRSASGPGDLGAASDIVVVAVVNQAQVRSVLSGPDGAIASMRPGTSIVILSTIDVATLREVAEEARSADVAVIDCGVTGGPAAAAEGALISMVGGHPDDVERARPVLDAFSEKVVVMGPLGAGLQAKLARNIVQYGSWLAAYEAQVLAEAAGVRLSRLAEVVKASDQKIGGASTLMFRRTVAPFGPDDDAGLVGAMRTASELAHKDLGAALALGGELGVDLPLVALALEQMDSVFGLGESDG